LTCFQRMHEVVLGVLPDAPEVDWDSLLWEWLGVTTLDARDRLLVQMAVEPVDTYDLPRAQLDDYAGLIISARVDQELMFRERETLQRFLDAGRVVVFSGQVFRPWLPGAGEFSPLGSSQSSVDELQLSEHPVLDGVNGDDLKVSFVHGSYPLPDGAAPLVQLKDGRTVTYVDSENSRGTELLHAGATLMTYISSNTSAQRMVPQLLNWIRQEGAA